MQDTESAGMSTDIDQILGIIYIYGFYVIGSQSFFLRVICNLMCLRVVVVYAAVVGTYPKSFWESSLIHSMVLWLSKLPFVTGRML